MTVRSHMLVALCAVLAWGVGQAARAQEGPEAGEEKEQPLNEVFQTNLLLHWGYSWSSRLSISWRGRWRWIEPRERAM